VDNHQVLHLATPDTKQALKFIFETTSTPVSHTEPVLLTNDLFVAVNISQLPGNAENPFVATQWWMEGHPRWVPMNSQATVPLSILLESNAKNDGILFIDVEVSLLVASLPNSKEFIRVLILCQLHCLLYMVMCQAHHKVAVVLSE
jgi:hypothetical protein